MRRARPLEPGGRDLRGRELLRASGAPGDYRKAIYAYNHAEWYVDEVEEWAARYRGRHPTYVIPLTDAADSRWRRRRIRPRGRESPTPIEFISGERAELDPADGHLAWIPEGVPTTVQAMVVAGNELQELPYGPDGHPDPRGALDRTARARSTTCCIEVG